MSARAKNKKIKNSKRLSPKAKAARKPVRKVKAAASRSIYAVRTKSSGRAFARPEVPSVPGVVVRGAMDRRYDEILTAPALAFVADLHRKFDATRQELLHARIDRQHRFDAGELPDFLPATRDVRAGDWKVGAIPADLTDRRVEITGPVDRKMVINALNSGANVFLADFEDACAPTWANLIEGQINLRDRWTGKLDFVDPQTKKAYKLGQKLAVLIVRPRGWHLLEEHMMVDGAPVSGALFDFGLYLFHNAKATLKHKTGPYFYLPKLENRLEARLWNEVFLHAQAKLGLRAGTIKSTVLIETLPAAFEMDEILYELREHITGLNCGRWDYIFSFIKRLGRNKRFLTPDRGQMGMDRAFLRAYSLLLIKTCHRRGAFAMGGMAAQIPVRGDPKKNEAAFVKVRADKEREAADGHDGTWVAHPDLVPIAKQVFDKVMKGPNQLAKLRADVKVTRDQLLEVHDGARTEAGLRHNIRVGIQYIEAWLRGRGAVPLYDLMEDAATAEISRAQVWQWLYTRARLTDGREVTPDHFEAIRDDEMAKVRQSIGPTSYDAGRFAEAIQLFTDMSLALEFEEFLTVPAYRLIA
jgi:malate synthase